MKHILILLLLVSSPAAAAARPPADDLYVSIFLVRGESSRDSSSTSTTITLDRHRIVYEETYSGHGEGRRKAVHKEYEVSRAEAAKLRRLILGKNLLVSGTLEYPTAVSGTHRYFEATIELRLNGRKSLIKFSGPANAVKIRGERLYQSSSALIEEIYSIINAQDKDVSYREPVS